MVKPLDEDLYVQKIHRSLGISQDLLAEIGLPRQKQASLLMSAGKNIIGRLQYLHPRALLAWQRMQQAAAQQEIILQLSSAYRSITYQKVLIERKLANQENLLDILKKMAPPGYSEHHTGLAIDLTTPGVKPVSEEFASTIAYAWLVEHAAEFNFYLSYPQASRGFIMYEPWHWCYHGAASGTT